MLNRVINPGNLMWVGEHWICYLRRPGASLDSGSVSLYHARYTDAREGTVAFVEIPGRDGLAAVCTDNSEVAKFIVETMVRGRGGQFDRDLPVLDSRISRGGDIRLSPSWVIQHKRGVVSATWSGLLPPLVVEGPGPVFKGNAVTSTVLFFAQEAAITYNGRPVGGSPYPRETWKRAIGREGSSCVFALGETMTTVTLD